MKFAGTFGVVTAGHCMDQYLQTTTGFVTDHTNRDSDLRYIQDPAGIYASANAYWYDDGVEGTGPGRADVGFLRRVDASVGYIGRLWRYAWNNAPAEWRGIEYYEKNTATLEQTVCVSASAAAKNGAGLYCGWVDATAVNQSGETTSGTLAWTSVVFGCLLRTPDPTNPPSQCKGPGGGASGGPVFYGTRVYGILTNANLCGEGQFYCSPGRFYRVNPMYVRMKEVHSDVYFICYPSVQCVPTP